MIKKPIQCIVCTTDVTNDTENFMVALEVPYMNLFLHRSCYGEISTFLQEFLEKTLKNYIESERNRK